MEERRAAQAVRWAVAATTTALPATLAADTATASRLREHAGASADVLIMPNHPAPSDTIAAAHAPQLLEPAVASLAGPRRSPWPASVNQKNVLLKLISVEKFLLDLV